MEERLEVKKSCSCLFLWSGCTRADAKFKVQLEWELQTQPPPQIWCTKMLRTESDTQTHQPVRERDPVPLVEMRFPRLVLSTVSWAQHCSIFFYPVASLGIPISHEGLCDIKNHPWNIPREIKMWSRTQDAWKRSFPPLSFLQLGGFHHVSAISLSHPLSASGSPPGTPMQATLL